MSLYNSMWQHRKINRQHRGVTITPREGCTAEAAAASDSHRPLGTTQSISSVKNEVYIGTCERNQDGGIGIDNSLSTRRSMKMARGKKKYPTIGLVFLTTACVFASVTKAVSARQAVGDQQRVSSNANRLSSGKALPVRRRILGSKSAKSSKSKSSKSSSQSSSSDESEDHSEDYDESESESESNDSDGSNDSESSNDREGSADSESESKDHDESQSESEDHDESESSESSESESEDHTTSDDHDDDDTWRGGGGEHTHKPHHTHKPTTSLVTAAPTKAGEGSSPPITPSLPTTMAPTDDGDHWKGDSHDDPSSAPNFIGSAMPITASPTAAGYEAPSAFPSVSSSSEPSPFMSEIPSAAPSSEPSSQPSALRSESPSAGPSSEPSSQPSALVSESPSAAPSSEPSSQPSSSPSDSPSAMPSGLPTELGTAHPSVSNWPSYAPTAPASDEPSALPSYRPSGIASDDPSLLPSTTPSFVPSTTPSEQPSHSPSFTPTSIPSISPSLSVAPTKVGTTRSPTQSPSTSDPTYSPTFPAPTANPSNAPSSLPSTSPSISPQPTSQGPTLLLTRDFRSELRMELFGMSNLLDNAQGVYYQDITARYMEEFYNAKNDGGGSILDFIKNEVDDMDVVIRLIDQKFPTTAAQPFSGPEFVPSPGIVDPITDDIFQVRMSDLSSNGEEYDDESYLPEDAIVDEDRRRAQFIFQSGNPTEVTEPCVGSNPLTLTYSMGLAYRTSDATLRESDVVVTFPFSAIPFRANYIDDYLKAEESTPGINNVFAEVYCTSQIMLVSTSEPSTSPSEYPSMMPSVTAQPSIEGEMPSISPSFSVAPSVSSSPSHSSKPSMLGEFPSFFPSISSSPSILGSDSPSTSGAPSGEIGTPSAAPSASSVPTASNVTSSEPTSVFTTDTPSIAPSISETPTITGPSEPIPPSLMPSTSALPTTDVIAPPPQPDLKMVLYGMERGLVDVGLQLYQDSTARYITDFYNGYNLTGDGDIRGDVLIAVASVEVTKQSFSDGVVGNRFDVIDEADDDLLTSPFRGSRVRANPTKTGPAGGRRKEWELQDEQQREPKPVGVGAAPIIVDYYISYPQRARARDEYYHRNLQNANDAAGDCAGLSLNLTLTMSIEYRTRGINSTSEWNVDDVINEPFSTQAYRDVYVKEYLQGDRGQFVLRGITCSGPVEFPATDGPEMPSMSPAPSGPTMLNATSLLPSHFPTQSLPPSASDGSSGGPTLPPNSLIPTQSLPPSASDGSSGGPTLPPNSLIPTQSVSPSASEGSSGGPTLPPNSLIPTQSLPPSASAGSSGSPTLPPKSLLPTQSSPPSALAGTSASPTLPPDSLNPTTSNGRLINPPPKPDLEMNLYGLISLTTSDQVYYAQETASYISDFYNNDNPSLQQFGLSNVTASIQVTDQLIPVGSTSGTDCSAIDPLAVTFSLDMSYASNGDNLLLDDIIAYPFSTEQFRQQYIDQYLKANDFFGEFDSLRCVSEVIFPESSQALSNPPTTTSSPSQFPSGYQDDIFQEDIFRHADREKRCSGMLDQSSRRDKNEEFELSFVYGVEVSASDDAFFVEDMESLILDFLATSTLRCSDVGHGDAGGIQKLRTTNGGGGDEAREVAGVVRIRYPNDGPITTTSKCDPVTPQAEDCVILSTKLLVTAVDVPIAQIHHDILGVLDDAFSKNMFTELVPEITSTSYLGPDPQVIGLSELSEWDESSEASDGGPKTGAIAIAVVGAALLLQVIFFLAYRSSAGQEAVAKVLAYYSKRHIKHCLPTSEGPSEDDIGDQRLVQEMEAEMQCRHDNFHTPLALQTEEL